MAWIGLSSFFGKSFFYKKMKYSIRNVLKKKFFQKPAGLELYYPIAMAVAMPYIFVFFFCFKYV
ncbi:hypothetical protein ACSSV5_000018 [Psychroflexus sp. MBR-150]|jgi:hypothetical protein